MLSQRWVRVVGSAVGITGIASAISFVSTGLLYRLLPVEQAGTLALLFTLTETLILVGGLGQQSLIIRLYSRQPVGAYDWRHDLRLVTVVTLPLIGLCVLAAAVLYRFDALAILFLLVAAPMSAFLLNAGQVLNSQGLYGWGNVILRLPRGLLVIPALVMLAVPALQRIEIAIAAQVITFGLAGAITWALLKSRIGRGDLIMTLREIPQGLIFVASISSNLIADQVLGAVAGLRVPAAEFAALAAFTLMFNPFQVVQNVFSKVLVPEFARQDTTRLKRVIVISGIVCALFVLAAAVLMPIAAHVVFGGRYDWAAFLIVPLALANAFDLAEVIPRSYLMGKASGPVLNRFIGLQVGIALIGLAVGIPLIVSFGIIGVTTASAVIFALRLVVSYAVFLRHFHSR
ncbi:MAG: hypothetical protein SF162_08875 [bacterium]|nr:hypothetical protein [bacterium]